jgi:hypothetical protein
MLNHDSALVITQLGALMNYLGQDGYSRPLPVLGRNSIGRHVRHVIELYKALVDGYNSGVISYDDRKRDVRMESDITFAAEQLNSIIEGISLLSDKPVVLLSSFDNKGNQEHRINSSYYRELAYNIEHTIHHMALIRIAVEQHFPEVPIEEEFGVAPSTIRYRTQCAQ